jgi:hypothetical protein
MENGSDAARIFAMEEECRRGGELEYRSIDSPGYKGTTVPTLSLVLFPLFLRMF